MIIRHIVEARDLVVGKRSIGDLPPSKCIFSNIVKPTCITAAPEICVSTAFGLIALPQSTTLTSLRILTCPVSVSTSTSAPPPAISQNGVTFGLCPSSGLGDT